MNAAVSVEQLLPELDQTHLDWLEEEAIFILRETVAAGWSKEPSQAGFSMYPNRVPTESY